MKVGETRPHGATPPPGGWRPRFSLRSKLALLALTLLALPWVGYQYVKEMERFLLEGQQQALVATARAVATALHDRPQLMRVRLRSGQAQGGDVSATLLPGEELIEAAPAPRALARESDGPRQAVAEVEAILKGLDRTTSRIWVANRDLRVLALAGSLKGGAAQHPPLADDSGTAAWRRLWSWLLARVVATPGEDFDDTFDEDTLASGSEVHGALMGAPGARVRRSRDDKAVIVSAAHPIWSGDRVLGVVVVEESTNSILSLRNQAIERLLLLTVGGFAVALVVVLGFASRLSSRIRRLRDEAERAIDGHGRITTLAVGSRAGDEVGDLSRSFSALLERLARHHTYLESMASRLSHELRTPIAVVRSSLENLRLETLPDRAVPYMDRAEAGLTRLSRILSRMSEATRMEQALATTDSQRFDLRLVVGECVNGYRIAYPAHRFDAELPTYPVWVRGAPDLAAQMLDKLVENAADFALAGTPIRIVLAFATVTAELSVSNQGPLLPPQLEGKLFESMVSARGRDSGGSGEPHLGLGLYVARMIAAFHGGTLYAENLPEGDGVRMRAELRLV